MPWKLIIFIIFLILAAVFIGFNLENACNIDFVFTELIDVPVFLTVLFSFLAGILITLPFTFGKGKAKAEKPAQSVKSPKPVKYSTSNSKPTSSTKNSPISMTPSVQDTSEQAKNE